MITKKTYIPSKIIISRTDNIGDVILTLPLCGWLKKQFPGIEIIFLGKTYTEAVVILSAHVDSFINLDTCEGKLTEIFRQTGADTIVHVFPDKKIAKAAKEAEITNRIGTSHRLFHWFYCNKLVNFSRRKSDLHEALLNILLIAKPMGLTMPQLSELSGCYGIKQEILNNIKLPVLPEKDKINIIFHPKSKGSAREWPVSRFTELAASLSPEKYHIYISGTATEGEQLKKDAVELLKMSHVSDLTGKFSLPEFIAFISQTDGLVAASTGPLHIAAMLGKKAIGIYPPMRPIHPGRWAPIGERADFAVIAKNCSECRNSTNCNCINSITAAEIVHKIYS